MDGSDLPAARPAELTVAAYAARLAGVDDARIRIEREIADVVNAFAKHAASVRAARKRPAPGAPHDPDEQSRQREALRAEEAALAEQERLAQAQVAEFRAELQALGAVRTTLLHERDALRRLDAWDALTAATRTANQTLATLATLADAADATDATERDALQHRAAAAIRRRRELWITWHLQFGGTEVPELLPLPDRDEATSET